jgi:hypothetical protein
MRMKKEKKTKQLFCASTQLRIQNAMQWQGSTSTREEMAGTYGWLDSKLFYTQTGDRVRMAVDVFFWEERRRRILATE